MTTIKVSTICQAKTIADLLVSYELFNSSEVAFDWMKEFLPDLELSTQISFEMRNFFIEKARQFHRTPLDQAARGRILEILEPTIGFTVDRVGVDELGVPYMALVDGSKTLFVTFHDHNCQWRGWPDVSEDDYIPQSSATVSYFIGEANSHGYMVLEDDAALEYIQKFFRERGGSGHLSMNSILSVEDQNELLIALATSNSDR